MSITSCSRATVEWEINGQTLGYSWIIYHRRMRSSGLHSLQLHYITFLQKNTVHKKGRLTKRGKKDLDLWPLKCVTLGLCVYYGGWAKVNFPLSMKRKLNSTERQSFTKKNPKLTYFCSCLVWNKLSRWSRALIPSAINSRYHTRVRLLIVRSSFVTLWDTSITLHCKVHVPPESPTNPAVKLGNVKPQQEFQNKATPASFQWIDFEVSHVGFYFEGGWEFSGFPVATVRVQRRPPIRLEGWTGRTYFLPRPG